MNSTAGIPVARHNPWIEADDFTAAGWSDTRAAQYRGLDYCRRLEAGEILFFKEVPFRLSAEERSFLISQRQAGSRFHKNISYKPAKDLLQGASPGDREGRQKLHSFMRGYSAEATAFLQRFLSPYAGKLQLDYASFRPLEEQGRDLPLHKRNDLLHVDAFPTRPTHGARILRVFTNVNPTQARRWRTGEAFHRLAPEYAAPAGLGDFAQKSAWKSFLRVSARALSSAGLPIVARSPYDEFMLHFHDWLKGNADFQRQTAHDEWSFPPGATWLVYTDGVPHAALSGQYALEHTYIVPRNALVAPECAPINVLEKIAGKSLLN